MPLGDPEKPVRPDVDDENSACATEESTSNLQAISPEKVGFSNLSQHPDELGLILLSVLVLRVAERVVQNEQEQIYAVRRDLGRPPAIRWRCVRRGRCLVHGQRDLDSRAIKVRVDGDLNRPGLLGGSGVSLLPWRLSFWSLVS